MTKPCISCKNQIDGRCNSYCKKCDAERNRRYYQKNKEKENARRHKYYRENKEFSKEFIKRWKDSNPDKVSSISSMSRARKRNAPSDGWTEKQALALYGSTCHICNKKIDLNASRWTGRGNWEQGLHFDHVVPLSRGGTNTIDNIRPSHGLCNISKGAGVMEEGSHEAKLY